MSLYKLKASQGSGSQVDNSVWARVLYKYTIAQLLHILLYSLMPGLWCSMHGF